ncbi:MAG: PD-(D/E)XK nuclease family protein [Gammaproteobacteria bacterium]
MSMTTATIDFLLVPDAGAARRLRRTLAETGARGGVIVGTWGELLEFAVQSCPPYRAATDWSGRFERALAARGDAFWSQSLAVAPRETATAVELVYVELRAALRLANLPALTALPGRVAPRYADLRRLEALLDGALPEHLARVRHVLATPAAQRLRPIRVRWVDGYPELGATERLLVEHLAVPGEAGASTDLDDQLAALAAEAGRAAHGTALARLQHHLFEARGERGAADDTLQWVGCRDALEEAEMAAGMVQELLSSGLASQPAEIALLLPDDYVYSLAVADTFARAGLPLAGLPIERWRRDLGRDVVLQFLHCRQKPAPAMAIAACLTSPLMPWSTAAGAQLAQRVMDGDYRLEAAHGSDAKSRAMLALLREGDERPATLLHALRAFATSLGPAGGLDIHLEQAQAAIALLIETLDGANAIDWRELRRLVAPRHLAATDGVTFTREGIAVWRESQEPWRAVRHLLVLGYTAGHYPEPASNSPVFTDDEKATLAAALGVTLPTSEALLARRRARLRRQLGTVSDSASFFVPRRGHDGQAVRLPDCHVFIADLLGYQDDAEALVMDVDDPDQRARLHNLATAAPAVAAAPRLPVLRDLDLGRDLIALRVTADGSPRPESPSGLETLMVSPLAWLLRRLGAEPVRWQPERPGVQLLGQLAHAVFEDLFRPGEPLPPRTGLERRIARSLDTRIAELAPFLRAAQWQVERHNLVGSLARAASAWRDKLAALDAEILGGELWLAGRFHDIDVHGQADLLLGLPDGRVLVVDYKRSSSGKRRARMASGFDSQASLYRTMIETGGAKAGDDALAARLGTANGIGVVYYLLLDQVALTDTRLDGAAAIPGWQFVDAEVAAGAVDLIGRRLDDVRAGRITLNGAEDEAWFDKSAAVNAGYALDISPLVRLHLRAGLAGDLA